MTAEFQVSGQNAAALFTLKLHRGDGMTLALTNRKQGTAGGLRGLCDREPATQGPTGRITSAQGVGVADAKALGNGWHRPTSPARAH